jgi:pimeloyl-ACP methyl ester carboxylesterase
VEHQFSASHQLAAPAWRAALRLLGAYGRGDKIVDPCQAELVRSVPLALVEILSGSRHFPMLDEPDKFNSMVLSYLAS